MLRHRVGRDDTPAVTFLAAVASSSFDVREGGRAGRLGRVHRAPHSAIHEPRPPGRSDTGRTTAGPAGPTAPREIRGAVAAAEPGHKSARTAVAVDPWRPPIPSLPRRGAAERASAVQIAVPCAYYGRARASDQPQSHADRRDPVSCLSSSSSRQRRSYSRGGGDLGFEPPLQDAERVDGGW